MVEMDNRVKRLTSAQECDQFRRNALSSGDLELANQARLRKVQIKAQQYATLHGITESVEIECIEALYAYEEVRTEQAGRTRTAARTWPMFEKYGVIEAVERVVDRPDDAIGYTALVEMDLKQYAFEAIILRYPARFSARSVERSKQRMEAQSPISELGSGWTEIELFDSIRAYFDMQRKYRAKERFTKASYYQQLADKYGRSATAFEYRMQNISYVLSLMGREWLPGLKPAKNVGAKIAATIQRLIAEQEGNKTLTSAAFEIAVNESIEKAPSAPPAGNLKPSSTTSEIIQYARDPSVKAWVLRRAKGKCECCTHDAPFTRPDGRPYLEVHHVRHMADEGPDIISNTVALCPNCHRELHFGVNAEELINQLYSNVAELLRC